MFTHDELNECNKFMLRFFASCYVVADIVLFVEKKLDELNLEL